MKKFPVWSAFFLLLCVVFSSTSKAQCRSELNTFEGRTIWAELKGGGAVTVVFEAGGGNDSSVWEPLAAQIREAGYATLIYDRAGLGQSPLYKDSYDVRDEVASLRALITHCKIGTPIVIVAHSYGGLLALLAAVDDQRIQGIVLLDAVIPHLLNKVEINAMLAIYRPQYSKLRKEASELAKIMIPLMEAYETTIKLADQVTIPSSLPIIDIVAENTLSYTKNTAKLWRRAHQECAQGNQQREVIVAKGSGHAVAKDAPELVRTSILKMIRRLTVK